AACAALPPAGLEACPALGGLLRRRADCLLAAAAASVRLAGALGAAAFPAEPAARTLHRLWASSSRLALGERADRTRLSPGDSCAHTYRSLLEAAARPGGPAAPRVRHADRVHQPVGLVFAAVGAVARSAVPAAGARESA